MRTKEEIYKEYSNNQIKWMQNNNCTTTKEVTLKLMEIYYKDKTEFEVEDLRNQLKELKGTQEICLRKDCNSIVRTGYRFCYKHLAEEHAKGFDDSDK